MSDIIIPPQGALGAGNSDSRPQQFLQQIQQQILSLPNNTTIFSTVVGVDRNANPVVRVAGLDLVLSSAVALAKGAQLAIKVDHGSGSVGLQLLSVDGKLPATQPQEVANQLPNFTQQPANLPSVKILQAFPQNTVLLAGQEKQAEVAASRPQTVVFSSQQNLGITGVVINTSPEIVKSIKASFKLLDPNALLPAEIKKIPDELRQGTEIKFRVLNISPPPVQTPETPELPNFEPKIEVAENGKVKITALVLGNNNNDELLVQTKLGQVVLDNPLKAGPLKGQEAKLPTGAVITLEIEQVDLPEIIKYTQEPEKAALKTLSQDFPALNQLAQSAAGKEVLSKAAGLHDQLAVKIIKFVNAVKNNKLEDWLSDELIKQLSDGEREQIVKQLRADVQNLNKVMHEQGQSWQTVFFPIFDGEELHQLQLHVKKFGEEEKKKDYHGTRFVVELEAGSFGEMQFDGLVQKSPATTNFNLVVRTHRNLDTEIKAGIAEIFTNASEITGFKGGVEFSVMREFPNRVVEEKLAKAAPHEKIDC